MSSTGWYVRAARLAALAATAAVLAWVASLLALGALVAGLASGPRSAWSLVPALPLALGVAALVLLVRAGWWSTSRRRIAVAVTALVTVVYGGLFINNAPVLYGIGDAHNAWTLMEMLRFDLVRVEELDVGTCVNIRYRRRGAPPSRLVRPVDCSRPHDAVVNGNHTADDLSGAAGPERVARRMCATESERRALTCRRPP